MKKIFHTIRTLLLLTLILVLTATSAFGASYYHTLSGKYTGGLPSPARYKVESEYTSKAQYANWREVYGSAMGDGALYRSRIPGNTSYGKIADSLIGKYGIRYVINLCETPETLAERIEKDSKAMPNYAKLYKNGKVYADELQTSYTAFRTVTGKRKNRQQIIECMKAIAYNRGPYLVHCTMGKDRTGELCLIAAALCGADYYSLLRDYRQSYRNYCYGATEAQITTFCKKNLDFLLQLITYEPTGSKWQGMDLSSKVRRYLVQGGMTHKEIGLARKHLMANY